VSGKSRASMLVIRRVSGVSVYPRFSETTKAGFFLRPSLTPIGDGDSFTIFANQPPPKKEIRSASFEHENQCRLCRRRKEFLLVLNTRPFPNMSSTCSCPEKTVDLGGAVKLCHLKG